MKKPSKIKAVTAKIAFLLPSRFRAITLFGVAYCNKVKDAQEINKSGDKIDSVLKCHETIHVRQAESTKNSWLLYYLKYIWQWICNFPLVFVGWHMAYKFIPFELEAYANETNYDYAYGKAEQWKLFKQLTLKEKRNYAKQYKNSLYTFRRFINDVMLPEMIVGYY